MVRLAWSLPGIQQRYGPNELLPIGQKVSMPLELHRVRASIPEARFQLSLNLSQRLGVQIFLTLRLLGLEQPVVNSHFRPMRMLCAHPVNVPLHLGRIRARRT